MHGIRRTPTLESVTTCTEKLPLPWWKSLDMPCGREQELHVYPLFRALGRYDFGA